MAAHLAIRDSPKDYFMLTIFVPDNISRTFTSESELPIEWKLYPYTDHCKKIGDHFFLKNERCLLQVPSPVTRGDNNILINSDHNNFEKIKIVEAIPFPFDQR